MTDIVVKCSKIDLVSGCKVEVIYNVDDEFAPASGLRGAFSRLQEIANLNNTMISRWPKCEERLGQKLGSTARRISLAPETFYSEVADMRSELPALIEMLDVLVPTVIKDRNDELKSANIKRAKLLVDEIFV